MKHSLSFAIFVLLASLFPIADASAQVTGICLHASSPNTPDAEVGAFEYTRAERGGGGYRFFRGRGPAVNITEFRFRGIVPYPISMDRNNPELPDLLVQYRATVARYPQSAPFLSPYIQRIDALLKEEMAREERESRMSRITIGNHTLLNPRYGGLEEEGMLLRHEAGVLRIPYGRLTDSLLEQIKQLDPGAAEVRVFEIGGNRLFNVNLRKLEQDSIWVDHAQGTIELKRDDLTPEQVASINEQSGGEVVIGKPLFEGWNEATRSYAQVLAKSGMLFRQSALTGLQDDKIQIRHAGETSSIPIEDLAGIPGMTEEDSERMAGWLSSVTTARIARAERSERTENVRLKAPDVFLVFEASGRVLQVLDGGALVADLSGQMLNEVTTSDLVTEVTIINPSTGFEVVKEISRTTETTPSTSFAREDLVFVEMNSRGLVDGQRVRFETLRVNGRYQYINPLGAQRTVLKLRFN